MKIAYIGNFNKLWDEEYIAQAFEQLGHQVLRIPERLPKIEVQLDQFEPDVVLWAKFQVMKPQFILDYCKQKGIKTVCWVWDLYWGYQREYIVKNGHMFRADLVFTSDGGHEDRWKELGINHKCIRQGIREEECYKEWDEKEYDVVFVGTYNHLNKERNDIMDKVAKDFDFHWFGKQDQDEIRGPKLNRLYGKTKIVIGDSVYSPNYWSNRVVETLGRGGFLIHQYVEGIEKEYPYLVTYERGNYQDLKEKIGHYIQNPKAREEIIKKNLDWVKNNHTIKQRCQELCQNL